VSTELMTKMDKLLAKAPEARHSYFQLKYFVLGKEPTVQGRLWQCLREIEARREAIRAMTREIEETRDRTRLLELEGEKMALNLRNKEKDPVPSSDDRDMLPILRLETEIRCRQLKRQREGLEEQLTKLCKQKQFAEEEARFFVQAFESLERIEPVKDYDDLKSQSDYWNSKVGEEINLRMLLQKPLDPEMVKTALALPDDCPVKIQTMHTLQHVEKQMAELKSNLQARRLEAARKETDAANKINPDAGV